MTSVDTPNQQQRFSLQPMSMGSPFVKQANPKITAVNEAVKI